MLLSTWFNTNYWLFGWFYFHLLHTACVYTVHRETFLWQSKSRLDKILIDSSSLYPPHSLSVIYSNFCLLLGTCFLELRRRPSSILCAGRTFTYSLTHSLVCMHSVNRVGCSKGEYKKHNHNCLNHIVYELYVHTWFINWYSLMLTNFINSANFQDVVLACDRYTSIDFKGFAQIFRHDFGCLADKNALDRSTAAAHKSFTFPNTLSIYSTHICCIFIWYSHL